MTALNVRRWPVLSIIGVLLALMAVVDIADNGAETSTQAASLQGNTLEVAAGSGSTSGSSSQPAQGIATWYCPAGWVAPGLGVTTSLVVINPDPEPVGMWVTYYPSIFDGGGLYAATSGKSRSETGRVERQTVSASGSLAILMPDDLIPTGSNEVFVSALVELDRPGASVVQLLQDGTGRSFMSCGQSVDSQWYFPAGSTTSDAYLVLGLFNPFQDSAVVDIEFTTDSGIRSPTAYSGLIVAPNSALYLDVGTEAPRWPLLSTSIKARSGQLVASKLQVFDGSRGIKGVNIALGSPSLEHQWLFPFGSEVAGPTAYVVYNPGEADARVEIDFRLDFDSVTPTELLIPPGQQYTVTVNVPQADSQLLGESETSPGSGASSESGASPDTEASSDTGVSPDSRLASGSDTSPTAQLPFYLPEQSAAVSVNLKVRHWAVVRTLSGSGVVAEQLRGGGEEVVLPNAETVDETNETDGGILDELEDVGEPEVIVRAAVGELGLPIAATKHIALGGLSNGPVVQMEDGSLSVQSSGIAIANPSSATIARVKNLATREEFELGPRRRVLLDTSDIVVLESTTPVVVAFGYALVEFRQVPEVFNR